MKRRLVAICGFVVFITLIAMIVQRYVTWDELVAHEATLRERIATNPVRATLVGCCVYTLVCLVPGTTGKSIVFGWLYGVWLGVLIVNSGLTIAAIVTLLASRYILQELVQARLGPRLRRIDEALARDGACYLFMLRLVHCPYSITNYVFGATSMRVRSFWWASQLGMLPGNIVFVYAGSQVPSLRQLADEGVRSVFSWQLLVAFVLLSVLPIVMRQLVIRWRSFRVSRQA